MKRDLKKDLDLVIVGQSLVLFAIAALALFGAALVLGLAWRIFTLASGLGG